MTQSATTNLVYQLPADRIGAISTYAEGVRDHRVRKESQVNAEGNTSSASETVLAGITVAAIAAAVLAVRLDLFLPDELDLLLTRVAMALQ